MDTSVAPGTDLANQFLRACCTLTFTLLAGCAAIPNASPDPMPIAAATPAVAAAQPQPPSQQPSAIQPMEPPPPSAESAAPQEGTPSGPTPAPALRELQRGEASWYGARFQGRRTASGERFDMHALTAAHRTLPFGTIVRVRSLRTGQEIDVRINDRGPFTAGRVIDVSRGAAQMLGLLELGTKDVLLLVPESTAATPALTVPSARKSSPRNKPRPAPRKRK